MLCRLCGRAYVSVCPTCIRALTQARLASATKTQDSAAVRILWVFVCNILTITKCQELSYKISRCFFFQ